MAAGGRSCSQRARSTWARCDVRSPGGAPSRLCVFGQDLVNRCRAIDQLPAQKSQESPSSPCADTLLDDDFIAELEVQTAISPRRALCRRPVTPTRPSIVFEKEALFNHEWLCVGRESQVSQPGDYFTTQIIGEPIIVARNRAGEIRAMSAVCQHRAMLVAEGRRQHARLRLPLSPLGLSPGRRAGERAGHGADLRLRQEVGAPAAVQGRGLAGLHLHQFRSAPRRRWPRAWPRWPRPSPTTTSPPPRAPPPMTGQFPWNWKVMFENNNDGYHANKLHHGPLHDFVPSERATFPEADPADAGFLRFNGTLHPDASFNPTQRAVLPIFPKLTRGGPRPDDLRQHAADAVAGDDQRPGDLSDPARHRRRDDGAGHRRAGRARAPWPIRPSSIGWR